jgi:V-type H+-transporting ATPase subunit H
MAASSAAAAATIHDDASAGHTPSTSIATPTHTNTTMPFSLDGDYALRQLAALRDSAAAVSWTALTSAGFVTDTAAANIKILATTTSLAETINGNPQPYADAIYQTLLTLSRKGKENKHLLKVVLTTLYDCLTNQNQNQLPFSKSFINAAAPNDPCKPFIKYLTLADGTNSTEDSIIALLAAFAITHFLVNFQLNAKENTQQLLSYIHPSSSSTSTYSFLELQLLKEILSVKPLRSIYLAETPLSANKYLKTLTNTLSNRNNDLQMKYLSIYCFWTLTFSTSFNKSIATPQFAHLIPLFFNFANDAVKEKVVRLSISSLLNILNGVQKNGNDDDDHIVKSYLLANGLTIVKNLLQRKWSDEDLKEDLQSLYDTLNASIKSLTTFDEYANELSLKKLSWSPCHKNQEFWFDNIDKFKENNWKLVSKLLDLLSAQPIITNSETDDENQLYLNQAIVCYDLAMLLKIAPEVSKIISKNNSKTRIMTLMNSPNSNVKFEALKATQMLVAASL